MTTATASAYATHNEFKLAQEIIARSEADDWHDAKLEWEVVGIEFAEPDMHQCLCSHFPIRELCHLENRCNGKRVIVGNVCVNKFLDIDTELVFAGIRRVMDCHTRALNVAAIEHCHAMGWLNDWERRFCLDTHRKRKLSDRQMGKRVQINRKVIRRAGVAE